MTFLGKILFVFCVCFSILGFESFSSASEYETVRSLSESELCPSLQKAFAILKPNFTKEVHLLGQKSILQLAWTGKNYEKILVVTTDNGNNTLFLSSDKYEFLNISNKLSGGISEDVDLVVIKHPLDPQMVYLSASNMNDRKTVLYMSINSFENYSRVTLNFSLISSAIFYFHMKDPNKFLAVDESDKTLHLTKDKGFSWVKIVSNVVSAKWSLDEDSPDDIFVVTNEKQRSVLFGLLLDVDPYANVLKKSADLGNTWAVLKSRVHSFGMEGMFIYVSIFLNNSDDRILQVSTDSGRFWNRIRLPTMTPDRFYSILDLSEGVIFLHVDDPGDTGRGILYVSDATGIIFSESMKNHLYPNAFDVTDFYTVKSMQGVFIANQLIEDNSIVSRITFNRGAEWQPVSRPIGGECIDESKPCFLQIHNLYSRNRGIKADPPLSVPNAEGIILVHGHVADCLQTQDPDVYVSNDGGYSWRFALKGPHHYQIADHGGLLVAVPSDSPTPKIIKFSANSGRCWVEHQFTTEDIVFTGLLIEPGNKDSVVALWGYTENDKTWHTFVFDFSRVVTETCQDANFEEWTAHDHNGNNCSFGRKVTFQRLKPMSWCLAGKVNKRQGSIVNCSCTRDDYGCDYGYVKKNDICKKEASSVDDVMNICLRNHQDRFVPLGYHKIPGDVCSGGFQPKEAVLVDLEAVCQDDSFLRKDSIKDEELTELMQSLRNSRMSKFMWITAITILICIMTVIMVFLARKYNHKYRNVSFKYSSIKSDVDDLDIIIDGPHKTTNTSVYDDISSDDEKQAPIHSNPSTTGRQNNLQNGYFSISDVPPTGYIHPALFDLVSNTETRTQKGRPPFDSDDELLD